MNNVNDIAVDISNNNKELLKAAKDRAFDLIGVGLIIAVGLISLGAITLRDITPTEIINMLLEAIPFYLASVTLSVNYYKKGVYSAKESDTFINCVKLYSHKVNKLTGKMLDIIGDFCEEYNRKALRHAQEAVLRCVAVSYERYNDVTYDKDGNELIPLRQLSRKDIVKLYNTRVADCVENANAVTVKGLNPNILLSNNSDGDITNLGLTEQELLKKRVTSYLWSNSLSIVLLTIMSIKNIMDWGWAGLLLTMFKLVFILCRCYMKYFEGHEDITQKVTTHISRKVDILKQFDYWYYNKHREELDKSDPEHEWLCNIFSKSSYNNNDNGCKTGDDGDSPKTIVQEN